MKKLKKNPANILAVTAASAATFGILGASVAYLAKDKGNIRIMALGGALMGLLVSQGIRSWVIEE